MSSVTSRLVDWKNVIQIPKEWFLHLGGQQVQAVLFDCLILNVVELRFSETWVTSPVQTA